MAQVILVSSADCCCGGEGEQFDCDNTAVKLHVSGWINGFLCDDCGQLNRTWCLLPGAAIQAGCLDTTNNCDYSCGYQKSFNLNGDIWTWNANICGEFGVGWSSSVILHDSQITLGDNYWEWATDLAMREPGNGVLIDFTYTFDIDSNCAVNEVVCCDDLNAQIILEVVPIEQCNVAGVALGMWPLRFNWGA